MLSVPHRHRSVGFLEQDGEKWACFLVTYCQDQRWHGYFSFRSADEGEGEQEVRTTDIFLEDSEGEIEHRARALGRPLLSGLLSSALHASGRGKSGTPRLRRWFREVLSDGSLLAERAAEADPTAAVEEAELRSLYASYRLDQVAHFIALVKPEDFQTAVEAILEGQAFDFGAKDRLQFAMMVVEYIESRLPLPPYRVWLDDYLADPTRYQLYAHTLHREGRLP